CHTPPPPRAPPLLRYPPPRPWCRSAHRAGDARPRVDQHDADLHQGVTGETLGRLPRRASSCDSPVSELARARHLVRRFVGSLSRKPPSATDTQWAEGLLLPGESALWQ